MRKFLVVLMMMLLVSGLCFTVDTRNPANAQAPVPTPVMIIVPVPPSFAIPPAPTVVYTVPAGKTFTWTSVILTPVVGDATGMTIQYRSKGMVTTIATTAIPVGGNFSLTLGLKLGAGDTIEVINGSNVPGQGGEIVNVTVVGTLL